MEFGKAENIDDIDFTLPDDHPDTEKLFSKIKGKKKSKKVYIGCAKWGRKEWVGKIYPPKTKERDFLQYYVKQFNCIELNATHYRMPNKNTIKNWKANADKEFKFCPKFPQLISHMKRLKNSDEITKSFFSVIENFENNLGICFLQLPPNFAPKSYSDLEKYIKSLPKEFEVCLELRHPDWFKNSNVVEDLYKMLAQNKIGTVITDTSGRRDMLHQRLTTPTAFIRFVGNNLHPTDYTRVDDWAMRIKHWLESGLKTIYFIIHQLEEEYSPELSAYAVKQINKHCGLDIKEPVFIDKSQLKK